MNVDRLNRWLTLVANIGVIAGIVFLAIELRQNNELLEAQSRADRREIDRQAQRRELDYPELRNAVRKAQQSQPLSDDEKYLVHIDAQIALTDWYYIFQEVQEGTLPETAMDPVGWCRVFYRGSPNMSDSWSPSDWPSDYAEYVQENIVDNC